MDPVGVYLHFPWCRKRCPYCDFAVETGDAPHERYRDAILAELDRRADAYPGQLVSIYLGGGTPSLWRPDCIASVIRAITERFGRTPDEVTIEANPTDVVPKTLAAWRDAGIARISIGVQSLAGDELVALGRDHRFGDGLAAIDHALATHQFRVSADFILGTPPRKETRGRSIAGGPLRSKDRPVLGTRVPLAGPAWIEPVTQTSVDHLSVYELTIEDRTAFGQRVRAGTLVPLDDDELTDLYVATDARLTAAGFEHYEISSYARPGRRAVHNSLYWRGAAYLGLGTGAASLELHADGSAIRSTNPRRAEAYLAGETAETTHVLAAEMAKDRAWLGLRTKDGIAARSLEPAPGVADWLVAQQLAEVRDGRICPTLRGFLFADRIASRIVQAWDDDRVTSL